MTDKEDKKWHSCEDHDYRTCKLANNCYSYVLNKPKYHWAVPGYGYYVGLPQDFFDRFNEYFKGYSSKQFQDALRRGAIDDGLISTNEPTTKNGYYLTALFLTDTPNNHDFHWLKQDDYGVWSHKDGWLPVSNVDKEGVVITDPLTMANSQFPIFGGYYLVPKEGQALKHEFSK